MAGKGLQPSSGKGGTSAAGSKAARARGGSPKTSRQQVIPEAVANRMARRIAIGTGIPTVMGMGVFIGS
jgi:hypothetical protein